MFPIVMVACDAVEAGLVQSLARPGAKVTGVTCISGDLAKKRFQLLRDAVPRFRRLAVLYNPGDPHAVLELRKVEHVARERWVDVRSLEARTSTDLPGRFRTMTDWRADALYVVGDTLTLRHAKDIKELAEKARLPGVYPYCPFAEAGGLIAYGLDLVEIFRRTGGYVDKILKGRRPGELPIEQPTSFELVINAKTAKTLGVLIPSGLALQAEMLE